MCGRFTQTYSWRDIHTAMNLIETPPPNLRARYNIAPTTPVDIVRQGKDGRGLTSARWGLYLAGGRSR